MFVFGLSLLSFAHCATIVCDVLIAGGSTASLAAALASARHGADTCLTDPTDWLGGQLTASAVSAIDFGWANNPSNTSFGWSNLPRSFRELLRVLSVDQRCWVSSMCYRPIHLLSFIDTVVRNTTNLRVFRSAVVVAVQSRASLVTSVQVVQRTAKSNTTGYEHLLSDQLADWYSASDSSFFTKVTLSFQARVFVDATEFGDVIGNLGKSVQGMESPDEDSQAYLSQCGQSHTVGFFIRALQPGSVCAGAPVPPGCKNCTGSFTFGPWRWDQVWSYRQVFSASGTQKFQIGNVDLQNWASMDSTRFLFSSPSPSSPWQGGIDFAALRESEQRSLAFFHWFLSQQPASINATLCIDREQTGTATGLAKMPYLRDSRRTRAGLFGFRFTRDDMVGLVDFEDKVGIGFYPADSHLVDFPCGGAARPPAYAANKTMSPFFIPFRALTVDGIGNLLVAGKTMAQTWMANTATREHPEEWTSGSAAGTAAALMALRSFSSTGMYQRVSDLQKVLVRDGQPLRWTGIDI
jgi:hypothetical protein